MKTLELVGILAAHRAWLDHEGGGAQAKLAGANLTYANLRGVDLQGADLQVANLTYADLAGAKLNSANLTCADLAGAKLNSANLTYADLAGAKLNSANLTGADLAGAKLNSANLTYADLAGANLTGADLYGANLRGANLRGANLILAGQDTRGCLFYAYANSDGVIEIRAGCRRLTGIAAARAHWQQRHLDNPVLHADCLSLVQRAETMAIARGWKLEPDTQPQAGQEGDNE